MIINLQNIRKSYGTVDSDRPVLDGLSLQVKKGEAVVITGPSGSGKTTLLNLIGGLDRPEAGSIELSGIDLISLSETELAAVRLREIGFVFQLHHLLPQCTVLENVLLPTLPPQAGLTPERARQRALALLQRLGLSQRADYYPWQLSGGERQRTAVARALINKPGILLADEPTGALDRTAAAAIVDLLLDLNRNDGLTMVVVTHSPAVAAAVGRELKLIDGRLV